MLGGKNRGIGDPDFIDASEIQKRRGEFHELRVDFIVAKCDLVAFQKQKALVRGGYRQLGILVRSAFSTIASRSPGILSRAIRQLPAMPGRCIVSAHSDRFTLDLARNPIISQNLWYSVRS